MQGKEPTIPCVAMRVSKPGDVCGLAESHSPSVYPSNTAVRGDVAPGMCECYSGDPSAYWISLRSITVPARRIAVR